MTDPIEIEEDHIPDATKKVEELKPCPFCNGTVRMGEQHEGKGQRPGMNYYCVRCDNCDLMVTFDQRSQHKQKQSWNTRPAPEVIADRWIICDDHGNIMPEHRAKDHVYHEEPTVTQLQFDIGYRVVPVVISRARG